VRGMLLAVNEAPPIAGIRGDCAFAETIGSAKL